MELKFNPPVEIYGTRVYTLLEKRAAELKLRENDAQYWKKQYLRLREKNRRKHLEQVSNLTSDPIVLSTMAKLNERSKVGVNKYETTLAQNDTDNFLIHLQQELLDGANYAEKLLQDQKKLSRKLSLLAWKELENKLTTVDITRFQNKIIELIQDNEH